jgi:transposase
VTLVKAFSLYRDGADANDEKFDIDPVRTDPRGAALMDYAALPHIPHATEPCFDEVCTVVHHPEVTRTDTTYVVHPAVYERRCTGFWLWRRCTNVLVTPAWTERILTVVVVSPAWDETVCERVEVPCE